jgi:hypothetical protein
VDDGAATEDVERAATTLEQGEDFNSEHLPKPLLHPVPQYDDEDPQ